MHRKIELLANVAIVVVALLVGAVLVKQYRSPEASKLPVKEITAGTKIALPDVDWQKNRQTMLVVLAQGCHYCAESAPFYQKLLRQTQERGQSKLMAVFPPASSDGKRYLKDLGVPIEEVKLASLDTLGVVGTPTLILVDNQGVVTDVWVGQLPPDKELEVLSRL
jgi:thioredoxin-related protein